MGIAAGQYVYCVEPGNPMFGRKYKVDLVSENGRVVFSGIESRRPIRFLIDQISEDPPQQQEGQITIDTNSFSPETTI